jgi:amino acid adenylation domain-containing protein
MDAVMTAVGRAGRSGATHPSAGPVFPLTDLQQGYLVGASGEIEFGGFRPNYYLELESADFDQERAERATDALVARHEQLRTVVLPDGEGQYVLPTVSPVTVPVVDATGLDRQRQEALLEDARSRMSSPGIDPTGWPLFQVAATRLAPRLTRVHLAMSLLLLDGASIRTVLAEWQQLYADPTAELPPVPTSVRKWLLDFAAHRQTAEHRVHEDYWRNRLDTLPEAPQLPLVAAAAGGRFVQRSVRLDAEAWRRLRTACQRNRILPAAALMHVFAEVLGAWSASPHFCLNVLHHGWATRNRATAGLVGQRGATLALEIDLTADGDFWDRARRVQRQLWRDLEHAGVSAVQVMREVARHRGWGPRAALPYVFTSMLAEPGQVARPVHCRTVTTRLQTPQVLIDNQIQDDPDGSVTCVWDVVDGAFPAGLPDLMFESYARMLRELSGPAGDRAAPEPVPAAFRERVAALNRTPGEPPIGRLEEGFRARLAVAPDAAAVIAADRTLTYRQLDTAARTVSSWLRARGVTRGDIVPIVMTKGWEQVAAALGVLLAGAAYCPIDPAVPPARIRAVLDECTAPVLLGQSYRQPDLGDLPRPATLHVDGVDPDGPAVESGEPDPEWRPGELAYVIYTSGSTGRPKGVMIDHEAALNTIVDVSARIGLGSTDRVFGISAMSFDLSVWDVFGTLAAGGCLVLPAPTPSPDPDGWARTAARHGATVWNSVPALAELLAEAVDSRPAAPRPPLRAFLLSGDWIGAPLPDRVRGLWPGARVIAMGGATEASIWSNVFEVEEVDPAWTAIPYGRPLAHQTMRVLDARLRLRPPWAVGQICIGGVGVARGYRSDPERTADRFGASPHTGERLYLTGDLGRYWPDGTIEFLGRQDRQVKIQGFRVELGDVEHALRSHPAVRDCVAVAQGPAGGVRRLTALVVPADGSDLDAGELVAHLGTRLPPFMVPGRIDLVPALPLTPNGKVDVTRAAALTVVERGGSPDGVEGPLARRLRALWAELLDLPAVRPDDDFFALGGNSLLALRMVNRLRSEEGLELTLHEVFEARTLRGLLATLRDADTPTGHAIRVSDEPGTPLTMFHPVGGSVISYFPLRQLWRGPVLAFQSAGLVGEPRQSARSLTAMVARYAAELRRQQPRGPYLLGGWSMGGVLAHEVGRVLASTGETVRVVMVDSEFDRHRVPQEPGDRHLLFLDDLARGRLPAAVADAVRAAPPDRVDAAAREAAVDARLLPTELDLETYLNLVGVHAHNLTLLAEHRPGPSQVPTLLVVAGRNPAGDPTPGWRTVCWRLRVETWPDDDHYSVAIAAGLERLTALIGAWLATDAVHDDQSGSRAADRELPC